MRFVRQQTITYQETETVNSIEEKRQEVIDLKNKLKELKLKNAQYFELLNKKKLKHLDELQTITVTNAIKYLNAAIKIQNFVKKK